jgi:hypothetical protein
LLKSTLLQLDSTFSERDYGVSTFRDFIEKVAKTGLVTLRHSGRSMIVDAVEALEGAELNEIAAPPQAPAAPAAAIATSTPAPPQPHTVPAPAHDPEQVQQIAEATRDIFNRATQQPRWPMYVRQLKQYIRGVDQAFDERKWGFATVMEFLRVTQREGIFRLERDRRGQVRVFPGAALQAPGIAAPPPPAAGQQRDDEQDFFAGERIESPMLGGESEPQPEPESEREPEPERDPESGNMRAEQEDRGSEVIELDEQPAPAKPRRTRKTSTAGKPTARKPTGARASARRRKTPVSA